MIPKLGLAQLARKQILTNRGSRNYWEKIMLLDRKCETPNRIYVFPQVHFRNYKENSKASAMTTIFSRRSLPNMRTESKEFLQKVRTK